jgi:signal transduction histidine kinase
VASAAGSIASGHFDARVARETDPDLDKLAVSFNRMVDEVSARSEADRRFAADVSHELRSPLQTLSAATSVLERRRHELDDRTAAAVDLLTAEVARFESLVTDLLELAKSDRPADRRPTDVVALTRAFVAARQLPPEVLDVTGEAQVLDVDPRRYEQVLANLVDNASKHAGGVVRIGVEVVDDRLVLEVDDEGAGVPLDERELVFDRFARGRASSMRAGSDGTGLGLALVTQHVQAHRGTVELLDRPGGGARFRVVLPGEAA